MRRTTRHVLGDRIALSALWLDLPGPPAGRKHHLRSARRRGIPHRVRSASGWPHHVSIRSSLIDARTSRGVVGLFDRVSGVFFVALPFSRYMHIFTEIPLIFLRRYKLHSTEKEGSFDRFQTDACSRCGICIDPCQLQSELGIDDVQSVYFLRDRRYNHAASVGGRTTA